MWTCILFYFSDVDILPPGSVRVVAFVYPMLHTSFPCKPRTIYKAVPQNNGYGAPHPTPPHPNPPHPLLRVEIIGYFFAMKSIGRHLL